MWRSFIQVDPVLGLTAAFCVAGILVASAIPKLRAMAYFEEIVVEYRLLPEALARPLARFLPWLELALALALMASRARSFAALAVALLVSAFGLAIAINLLRGRSRIDCGCGVADAGSSLSWPMLGRNVFLLVLLAICACDSTARALLAIDGVTVVAGGGALIGLYLTADYLLANLPRLNEQRS